MSSNSWVGRASRCCVPQNPPLMWVGSIDEHDESVVEFAEWVSGLARFARNDVMAQIDALCGLAARGELVEGTGDIEPIRTDPDLYELRWRLLSKVIRQYHGEPARHSKHLVKLHLHIKADSARQEASGRSQQEEIELAIGRYYP